MSAHSDNKLRELARQIEGLPNQSALVRNSQVFKGVIQEAQQRVEELTAAATKMSSLRVLKDDEALLLSVERAHRSAVQARAREVLLLVRASSPDPRKISDKLDGLKKAIKSLDDEAQRSWASFRDDFAAQAAALEPIAQITSSPLLESISELKRVLSSNSAAGHNFADVVHKIKEATLAIDDEFKKLKFDQPIVEFIRDARDGKGDPKALFDARIRAHLDANPILWKFLRVTMI